MDRVSASPITVMLTRKSRWPDAALLDRPASRARAPPRAWGRMTGASTSGGARHARVAMGSRDGARDGALGDAGQRGGTGEDASDRGDHDGEGRRDPDRALPGGRAEDGRELHHALEEGLLRRAHVPPDR